MGGEVKVNSVNDIIFFNHHSSIHPGFTDRWHASKVISYKLDILLALALGIVVVVK